MNNEKVENIIKMVKELKHSRYIDIIYKYVLYYYNKRGELPPKKIE